MFAQHHLRIVLILVAIGLAGALAWNMTRGQAPIVPREVGFGRVVGQPPTRDAIDGERRLILARVAERPAFKVFFERATAAYPRDLDKLLDAFARRGLDARSLDGGETYVSDTLRALRRDRGVMAGRASLDLMTRVFEAQARLLGGLAGADKRLCVDFLLGQTSPAFLDQVGRNPALLADLATATIDAMIDGESRRLERGPPTDGDFDLLEAALTRHGLGKPEIAALLDGRLPDPPIPDAALCDAGLVYFDALGSLPEDVRDRLYALAIQAMGKS